MALGNHRKSIRTEIANVTEQVRTVSLEALKAKFGEGATLPEGRFSPGALLLLITGIPKFLNLEEGIGVKTAHSEIVEAFERYLYSIEPPKHAGLDKRRRPSAKKTQGRVIRKG